MSGKDLFNLLNSGLNERLTSQASSQEFNPAATRKALLSALNDGASNHSGSQKSETRGVNSDVSSEGAASTSALHANPSAFLLQQLKGDFSTSSLKLGSEPNSKGYLRLDQVEKGIASLDISQKAESVTSLSASSEPLSSSTVSKYSHLEEGAPVASNSVVYEFPNEPAKRTTITDSNVAGSAFSAEQRFGIARISRKYDAQDSQLIHANSKYIAYALANDPEIRVLEKATAKTILLRHSTRCKFIFVAWGEDPAVTNTLLAVDTEGRVVVWRINFEKKTYDVVFQLGAAVSPLNAIKSRCHWLPGSSNRFAVALAKNIYFFDLQLLLPSQIYLERSNLGSDGLPCYVIDTGISAKEYAFSHDGTVFATVDKDSLVKLYAVPQSLPSSPAERPSPNEVQPIAVISTECSEKPKCIQFISAPGQTFDHYIIVGYDMNRRVQLLNIAQGAVVQEFVFPYQKAEEPISFSSQLAVYANTNFLVIGNGTLNSMFLLQLEEPVVTESEDEATSTEELVRKLVAGQKKPTKTALFTRFLQKTFEPKYRFINMVPAEVIPDASKICLLLAHIRGYDYYTVDKSDLINATAVAIKPEFVSPIAVPGSLITDFTSKSSKDTLSSGTATPKSEPSEKRKEKRARSAEKKKKDQEVAQNVAKQTTAASMEAFRQRLDELDKIKASVDAVSRKMETSLNTQYNDLSKQLLEYKMLNEKNTEAIIEAVSETLTKNTGKILEDVVNDALKSVVFADIQKSVSEAMKKPLKELQETFTARFEALEVGFSEERMKQNTRIEQLTKALEVITKDYENEKKQHQETSSELQSLTTKVDSLNDQYELIKQQISQVAEKQAAVETNEQQQQQQQQQDTSSVNVDDAADASISAAPLGQASNDETSVLKDMLAKGAFENCVAQWCQNPTESGFALMCTCPTDELVNNCSNIALLTFLYHLSTLELNDAEHVRKSLEFMVRAVVQLDVADPQLSNVIVPVLTHTKAVLEKRSSSLDPVSKRRLDILLKTLESKMASLGLGRL
ncbi:fungal protein [Schizosaccharomyces japonicus yFS275]|uniref:Fungal protein n=1 Tax=Schizosaccharomyces japonicus (strain yFS275 / FY16936) TaxID=402676 RepID=B6K342_SCHJY|nr:fungal protein [Schizosaccharomyces japonicus yFS275]EEB07899.1 fungal protein [Schizosaccharomyces japonicus yFS275]